MPPPAPPVPPFQTTLARHGLELCRGVTDTLQINVGRRCNLACRHCHLEAGPHQGEMMTRTTMEAVGDFAARFPFKVADITGGAPELAPDLDYLLERLSGLVDTVMLRTNLTLLLGRSHEHLLERCRTLGIILVASFPSTNRSQADAQRGDGVWQKSIDMLKRLNSLGYGMPGSGLELHLVANPAGAFMPADQCRAEQRFKQDLARRWDIRFNNLYTFANVPLGRFRSWLEHTGNLDDYLAKLYTGFNPDTISGLMCRTLISVSRDGYLYDCDFNLAAGRPHTGLKLHISEVDDLAAGTPILSGDYCYACTAGSGFT